MEKSIQIASKRSLFSVTFGCGENGPERAAKESSREKGAAAAFIFLSRFTATSRRSETIALVIAIIRTSLPLMSS